MSTPAADRPYIPDYGIPQDTEGLLEWSYVEDRLSTARHYWLATASPEGRPHAVPVWGVWLEGALYFGGGPDVLWQRNLRANPLISVHLESGSEVVVIEGEVVLTTEQQDDTVRGVMAAYEGKYQLEHPPPFWTLRPERAFAWTDFAKNPTRWRFD